MTDEKPNADESTSPPCHCPLNESHQAGCPYSDEPHKEENSVAGLADAEYLAKLRALGGIAIDAANWIIRLKADNSLRFQRTLEAGALVTQLRAQLAATEKKLSAALQEGHEGQRFSGGPTVVQIKESLDEILGDQTGCICTNPWDTRPGPHHSRSCPLKTAVETVEHLSQLEPPSLQSDLEGRN